MDKQDFDKLVRGVREMKRHMAGKSVAGARVTRLTEPDVRAIREAADISQARFAKLIGVNLRTLQNWEQQLLGRRGLLGLCSRSWLRTRKRHCKHSISSSRADGAGRPGFVWPTNRTRVSAGSIGEPGRARAEQVSHQQGRPR